jgi:putative membrane protein
MIGSKTSCSDFLSFVDLRRFPVGLILGVIIAIVAYAVVIYIVGKLGLGMEVSGFAGAIVAAIVISIVTAIVVWLMGLLGLSFGTGILGAIISLIVAAIVLLISDRFVSGLRVNGFVGAIIAAIAIGVVTWLIAWLLSLFGF